METSIGRFVPAWFVGFSGALLVLLSAVFSSIFWSSLDAEIQEKQSKVAELNKDVASMWDNHKLADLREAFSDQMLGMFLLGGQHPEFFLGQSGSHLRGSVLAMTAAASRDDREMAELKKYTVQREKRLSAGDIAAYRELKAKIDELRLGSAQAINTIGKDRLDLES